LPTSGAQRPCGPEATAAPCATGRTRPLPLRGWPALILAAGYVAAAAVAARLLVAAAIHTDALPWYVGLVLLYFVLFTLVWFWPGMPRLLVHSVLVVQSVVVIALLLLKPEFDWATSFAPLLAFQAALIFDKLERWIWVGLQVVLIAASLMATLGPARGLGLALTAMAVTVAFPALALASRDIEVSRARSRAMVAELQATNERLRAYAAQVEELAVVEERNRLARELHDSVSQAMFSVQLATKSAQILLQKDPEAVQAQLDQLQSLTHDALARMRGFISELRPPAA
jgi:signal transduction histidine kinase